MHKVFARAEITKSCFKARTKYKKAEYLHSCTYRFNANDAAQNVQLLYGILLLVCN